MPVCARSKGEFKKPFVGSSGRGGVAGKLRGSREPDIVRRVDRPPQVQTLVVSCVASLVRSSETPDRTGGAAESYELAPLNGAGLC